MPPETHFDKKLMAGLALLFAIIMLLYALYAPKPSDIIIGAFISWIGGNLGSLGNLVTGRLTQRKADGGKNGKPEEEVAR